MSYYYFPKSTPKPVRDGIKAKSKRGQIGETWWSARFIESLSQRGLDSRMQRGRSYARKGQVISLSIRDDGTVVSSVQGSSRTPYSITISFRKWNSKEWKVVIETLSASALFTAELLAGEIPHEIAETLETAGINLFPKSSGEINNSCSCPDFANPCKHIAAAYYLLAEQFDEDPFLIFTLRGKNKEQFLSDLREMRGENNTTEIEDTPEKGEDMPSPEGFYRLQGDLMDIPVHLSDTEGSSIQILKLLGPSPFTIGRINMADLIVPAYGVVFRYVNRIVHQEERE